MKRFGRMWRELGVGVVSRVSDAHVFEIRRSPEAGVRIRFFAVIPSDFLLVHCGIKGRRGAAGTSMFGNAPPAATMSVESSSKVVANLVRTLLRSPRCTAHHHLMGSSEA